MEETADAPLGGASPPVQGCASDEEEPPVVADCTSLTLVDGTQGELVSLLVENQDLGVEPFVLGEDTFPAAPAAPNFEKSCTENEGEVVRAQQDSSTHAEMKLHSEQEYFASLPADNLIYRTQPENLHEPANSPPRAEVVTTSTKNGEQGTSNREQGYLGCQFQYNSSTTDQPVCEKWSMEAITQRSQLRPARTARLNTAKALGESPGFEYL